MAEHLTKEFGLIIILPWSFGLFLDNIVELCCNGGVQEPLLNYMEEYWAWHGKDQIEELQAAFQIFDKDNDGVITTQELEEVVRSFGHITTVEEVGDIISQLDTDKSGTVDFHEFLMMMGRKMTTGEQDNELRQAFNVFDDNNDGFIRW